MCQPNQIELDDSRVEVGWNRYEDVSGKAGDRSVSVGTPVDSCEGGLDLVFVKGKLEERAVEPSAWSQQSTAGGTFSPPGTLWLSQHEN